MVAAWLPRHEDASAREASARLVLAEPRELLREEFFALELTGDKGVERAGYAAWRRRREDGGQVLELDIAFPAEGTRVSHVERSGGGESRLVWREWRHGGGRSLSVHSPRGETRLDVVEWGRSEALRERWDAPGGALMPLYLLELARQGALDQGSFACIDPSSRSLAQLELSTTYAARAGESEGFDLERTVALSDCDGVQRGAYTFCGGELVGFAWSRGDLRARRIAAEEFFAAQRDFARVAARSAGTVTER